MADSQFSYTKPPHFPPNPPVELKGGGGGPSKPARKAKSFTRFFCKFLFFALFLVAIPLFPSQAPGFITQSLLTKFWELVHLLFIGVAVSYGLFCRRNVDVDYEAHTTDDDSESYVSRVFRVSSIFEDEYDNSCGYGEKNAYQNLYSENYKANESFVGTNNGNSLISEQKEIGSFDSESGYEYSCGYGDNNESQAWNSQYFQGESMVVVAQPDCSLNRYGESGSMMSNRSLNLPIRSLRPGDRDQDSRGISDGSESSSPFKDSSNSPSYVGSGNEFGDLDPTNLENRVDETDSFSPKPWHSRSERMEFGGNVGANAASHSHFRPLSIDETQFESLNPTNLENRVDEIGRGNEFGDLDPTNLENRVDETDSFSPMPWGSRSERMEFRGNVGANAASHSHVRPLSIDETQFESLKSKSLWSSESFSSQASSMSDSPNGVSPSHGISSELENLRMEELGKAKMEELEKGKSFRRSYPPDSKQENKKTSLNAFHIRRYSSSGSLFEKNSKKSFEGDSRDTSKSKREHPLSSDVGRSVSLKFNGNPENLVNASLRDTRASKNEAALSSDVGRSISSKFDRDPLNLVKASPRGKSVRTIRSQKYALEAMKHEERRENHFSNKLYQKSNDEVEAVAYKRKHEPKNNIGSNNLSSTGATKHDLDNNCAVDMPKATSSELQKRRNREIWENIAKESKEEPAKETENHQVSSDVESVTDSVSDAGSNTHEVDKKAGEFIAKFRQQIRLQKMASIDRSKGCNHFR